MRTRPDRGANVVEFGLLVAALALCIVGVVSLAGAGVQGLLTSAITALTG